MGKKCKVDEKFFNTWSSTMSYILGYMYADGSIIDSPYMRGKYIQINSIDKDSILRVKHWLKSEHTITTAHSPFSGGKIIYKLRIGSHALYNDLFKRGLYPNKSLTVTFPRVPKKYLGAFIRGYFDGDGCIFFEKGKGKNGTLITKRIRIIFTSGSKVFLEQLDATLKNNIMTAGNIYQSKRSFQLKYNTKDSIQIFKLMYKNTSKNSFFMRKFNIFKEYYISRPSHIDTAIRTILNTHGHVVK